MGLNASERTYLAYLIPLRLWIGGYLLYQGIRKYLRDFPPSDWIGRQIGDLSKVELYPWYQSFLADVVVPNKELFGYLVMYGEILVGLCLVLGLLTRLSALVGLFMLANYYFGPGMARGGAVLGQQQTFLVSLLVILLANPGRTFGIDGFLFKRK